MSQDLDVYQKMDMMDDQQIVAQITNNINTACSQHMFYSFKQGGKKIENLSKKGIDECRLRYVSQTGHRIIEGKPDIQQDPIDESFIWVVVQIEEWKGDVLINTFNGCKRQNVRESFYFEKGVQKAIRNALMRMIPQGIQQNVLQYSKQILQNQQQRQLPQQQKQLPTPKPTVEQLVKDQRWMNSPFPWDLTAIIGGEPQTMRPNWNELSMIDFVIAKKNGKQFSLRQYLHMFEKNQDRGVYFTAALHILKEQEQPQQPELFDNAPDTAQHKDPAEVSA